MSDGDISRNFLDFYCGVISPTSHVEKYEAQRRKRLTVLLLPFFHVCCCECTVKQPQQEVWYFGINCMRVFAFPPVVSTT